MTRSSLSARGESSGRRPPALDVARQGQGCRPQKAKESRFSQGGLQESKSCHGLLSARPTRRGFLRLAAAGGLLPALGCGGEFGSPLPARSSDPFDATGLRLVARFAHLTDTHLTDTTSPARFPPAHVVTRSAWRPYEAYATQLLDGILRTINRLHASGRSIDFVLHTGDATDNAHGTELDWLTAIFDGRPLTPLTMPDDRPAAGRPPPAMDPYAAFTPAGLYRAGVHGPLPSIPWYALLGNHDAYAVGVFPFFDLPPLGRVTPLPSVPGTNIIFPAHLHPGDAYAYGAVTPARPGPPDLSLRGAIPPNPARAYYLKSDLVAALSATATGPAGHGFAGSAWYSTRPVPGLRLIGLDTSDHVHRLPGFIYVDGCISAAQLAFLRAELDSARAAGEIVVVATHHPSAHLQAIYATAVDGPAFRALLAGHDNVAVHLCGHNHRNRVSDAGGYLEMETCSTLDRPQEARLVEIYRNDATGEVRVAYEMFSHVEDDLPPLGDDPLRELRVEAARLAGADPTAAARQRMFDPSGADPRGAAADRRAARLLR